MTHPLSSLPRVLREDVKRIANETTGEEVARIAGKVLRDPLATPEMKKLAASCLTQYVKDKEK